MKSLEFNDIFYHDGTTRKGGVEKKTQKEKQSRCTNTAVKRVIFSSYDYLHSSNYIVITEVKF